MKLKTFFFLLFILFITTLYSQVRTGRALSEDAREPFPEREERRENSTKEKKEQN